MVAHGSRGDLGFGAEAGLELVDARILLLQPQRAHVVAGEATVDSHGDGLGLQRVVRVQRRGSVEEPAVLVHGVVADEGDEYRGDDVVIVIVNRADHRDEVTVDGIAENRDSGRRWTHREPPPCCGGPNAS